MSADPRLQPVSRPRVAAAAGLLLLALSSVVVLTELLRHPAPVEPVPTLPDPGDPRDPTVCEVDPASATGAPPTVTSDDLFDCPHLYEERTVHYEGEVIGALMARAQGVWTQLNDDVYAGDLGPLPAHREFRGGNAGVGVLLPHEVAARVDVVGGPDTLGDVLRVTGTFHRSDPLTGEVGIIRARRGQVVRPGEPIEQEPLSDRRIAGAVLGAAAALALALGRAARRA